MSYLIESHRPRFRDLFSKRYLEYYHETTVTSFRSSIFHTLESETKPTTLTLSTSSVLEGCGRNNLPSSRHDATDYCVVFQA